MISCRGVPPRTLEGLPLQGLVTVSAEAGG